MDWKNIYIDSRWFIISSYGQSTILSFTDQSYEPAIASYFSWDEVITPSVWLLGDIVFGLKGYVFRIVRLEVKIVSYV
mgnify:FL=1